MDIRKIKELNEKIMEKASANVEKSLVTGSWDAESFEAFSDAIVSAHKLHNMEKEEHKQVVKMERKERVKEDKTEFEEVVWNLLEQGEHNIYGVMTVLNSHMEDLKVLQPRFYTSVITKLKEMCK
jgi:hypothetical protein